MSKKIVLGALLAVVAGAVGLVMLANSALASDAARQALAAEASQAIGQPVAIGRIGVSVFPRITIDLGDVTIGDGSRVRIESLHLGAGLAGLFSRRIDQAVVRIDGARIALPLPALAFGAGSPAAETGAPAVTLGSIQEITFTNVEFVSGPRTVRGDVALVPEGRGVAVRRLSLAADGTAIEMTGAITSFDPLEGRLEARASAIDFDALLGFLREFGAGATAVPEAPGQVRPAAPAAAGDPAPGIRAVPLGGRLVVTLALDQATTGGLVLTNLSAVAAVTPDGVMLDPLVFGVFGGRYEGSMVVGLGQPPRFTWRASVTGINTGDLMAFAGSPGAITGTLAGAIALEGEGLGMDDALGTARGMARVDITDGTIRGLSLVRTIVTATSGRGDAASSAMAVVTTPADAGAERFSTLGATFALAGGVLRTADVTMASPDVDLTAAGSLTLATLAAELAARVRLSEALSNQGGTDLRRYAQENGRVVVPATIAGPLDNLAVRIDLGDAAARALRNHATEELNKALEKLPGGIGGLLRRPGRRGGGGGAGQETP